MMLNEMVIKGHVGHHHRWSITEGGSVLVLPSSGQKDEGLTHECRH